MGKKSKNQTPSKKNTTKPPSKGMKTRSQPDTPGDNLVADTAAVGEATLVDPPSPVVQQLADEFDGILEQGREEVNILALTVGTQSMDDLIAAAELEESADCREDPTVAHIPDPIVMKKRGLLAFWLWETMKLMMKLLIWNKRMIVPWIHLRGEIVLLVL